MSSGRSEALRPVAISGATTQTHAQPGRTPYPDNP